MHAKSKARHASAAGFIAGLPNLQLLKANLEVHSIPFQEGTTGVPVIFFSDPDNNVIEVMQTRPWRKQPRVPEVSA